MVYSYPPPKILRIYALVNHLILLDMAIIDDLPTELLVAILQWISTEDLQPASLISRRVRHVTLPLLNDYHRAMKSQYHHWDPFIEVSQRHPELCDDPEDMYASLVRVIVSERKLANLVEHITLRSWEWRNGDIVRKIWKPGHRFSGESPGFLVSRRQHLTESKTSRQIVEEAIRQSEYILNDEADYWLEQPENNREDLTFALLIIHLPALRTLDLLVPIESSCKYLLHAVEHIAFRSIRRALAESTDTVAPWQNLRRVSLTFSHIYVGPLCLVGAFISLPSLLTFEAAEIYVVGNEYVTDSGIPARISTVERLQFSASIVPVQALCDLLRVTQSLKEFTYVIQPSERDDNDDTTVNDAIRIVSALSQSCGATLEILRLSATRTEKWQPVETYQGFSRLNLLQMSTNILIAPGRTNARNIAVMLPKSLRCLVLQCDQGTPVKDIGSFHTFLQCLAQHAKDQLPLLTKICTPTLVHSEQWDQSLIADRPWRCGTCNTRICMKGGACDCAGSDLWDDVCPDPEICLQG